MKVSDITRANRHQLGAVANGLKDINSHLIILCRADLKIEIPILIGDSRGNSLINKAQPA